MPEWTPHSGPRHPKSRASSWSVYDNEGNLIGDVHGGHPRQYDAVTLSGKYLGTFVSQGGAVRAVRREAGVTDA
jgi:hypothetical protein